MSALVLKTIRQNPDWSQLHIEVSFLSIDVCRCWFVFDLLLLHCPLEFTHQPHAQRPARSR